MNNFFLNIFTFFQHRKTLLWLFLVSIIVLLCFSASRISFVEDISSFFPNNADNRRINDAYQKLGSTNKIVVTFSQKDTTQDIDENLLIDAATHFAEVLTENDTTNLIKELVCEINNEQINNVTNFITQNLPYFLDDEDYRRIDLLLQPQAIEEFLKLNKDLLLSPMGGFVRNVILNDPLYFSQNALKNLEIFKQNDEYNTDNGFIFNSRGECIVTITSNYPISETANNKLLANAIYDAANLTIADFNQEIKIVPFGAALISITNADRIKKDAIFAVSVALVLILVLLFYFFRSVKSLFLIAVSIVFGALFSLGLIVVFKSTVSVIAIGVASIIFGIAINYPLHFLARVRQNSNIKQAIKEVVNPLLIGNITTVGAFLSLLFISSDAMKDLGLFSSFLLIGTVGFVLVFLPHFWGVKGGKELEGGKEVRLVFGKLAEFSPEKNKYVVLTFLVFTVVLFVFSFGTKFETDLHVINYMTDEQRAEMDRLIEDNKNQAYSLYVVAEGKTIEEALQNYERYILPHLSRDGDIGAVSGISNLFPSQELQKQKIDRWINFWQNKKEIFIKNFTETAEKQGFNKNVFDGFITTLNREYNIQEFDFFAPIYKNMGENYFSISEENVFIYTILQPDSTHPNSLTPSNSLTPPNSPIFTLNNTSIAEKMVNALSDDFNRVLYICGFIVFIFLFFSFGRIELAISTFIPLMVAWIWILGLMNIFGLKFNIVNIILATFIFGQGDDYTIFVTEGLISEYSRRKKMLAAFKNSIILSAAILFIAIGTLIFAKHPAMRSLAELAIVGMLSVVMCAYLFPPLIFRWLTLRKNERRLMPITLTNLASSVYAFLVFLIGSIVLTTVGFFFFTLGKTTDQKKLRFHRLIRWVAHFVVTHIPRVKTTYNNFDKTAFDKPAIIICNHQSHIDLMCVMSLTPKLIILTNDWVWNSPFYGRMIKYADFYPVSNGVENAMDKLKTMVEKGYSIVIFPEGTRSEDCSIQRFHRGAFYLAEQLNLDILPIVIHGVGHLLPKKEFMLRKGEIHINTMPRMAYNAMGETLAERAKNTRIFHKKEYAKLAVEVETADYYADLVLHNYIYKGASVERTVRRNLNKHNNYRELISNLKNYNRVLIKNCGYGELPLLLSLVHKNMTVVATDHDTDKLELASNCTWVGENLRYVENVDLRGKFDVVVELGVMGELRGVRGS